MREASLPFAKKRNRFSVNGSATRHLRKERFLCLFHMPSMNSRAMPNERLRIHCLPFDSTACDRARLVSPAVRGECLLLQ